MYFVQNITAIKSAASARYPQPLHATYCRAMHGCVYEGGEVVLLTIKDQARHQSWPGSQTALNLKLSFNRPDQDLTRPGLRVSIVYFEGHRDKPHTGLNRRALKGRPTRTPPRHAARHGLGLGGDSPESNHTTSSWICHGVCGRTMMRAH